MPKLAGSSLDKLYGLPKASNLIYTDDVSKSRNVNYYMCFSCLYIYC